MTVCSIAHKKLELFFFVQNINSYDCYSMNLTKAQAAPAATPPVSSIWNPLIIIVCLEQSDPNDTIVLTTPKINRVMAIRMAEKIKPISTVVVKK